MGSTRQPAKAPVEAPWKAWLALAARRTSVAKRKPKIATREKKNENNNSRLIDGCDESLCSRQKSAGPDRRSQSATEAVKIIVVKNTGVRAAAIRSRDCTAGAQCSSRRLPMTTVMPTNAEAKAATKAGVPRCWRVCKLFKTLSSRVSRRSTLRVGRAQSHPHPLLDPETRPEAPGSPERVPLRRRLSSGGRQSSRDRGPADSGRHARPSSA